VFCGSISLASGSDTTVHFGLRSQARVKRLTIEWPSGQVQVLRKVKADRLINVTEPVQEGT
ncbi:MAG: ASPIC/UnbV domain-containing protein, partial [bacterium]